MNTRDDLRAANDAVAAEARLQSVAERSGMDFPPLFATKPETRAMVAAALDEQLATGKVQTLRRRKGRPTDADAAFKCFAAWFALHCDPELMALPNTENGDPNAAAVALALPGSGSGSRLKQLAKQYRAEDEPVGNAEHMTHCIGYLRLRKIEPTPERVQAMERAFQEAASKQTPI